MKTSSKNIVVSLLKAAVISVIIGVIINVLMGGSFNRSLISYLWTSGYSISIGLPLFSNGYLFNWFEKRYIDWIKNPVRSVLIAMSIHLGYSTLVIFSVNWFWFIVILKANWEGFWQNNRGTIISEYIVFVVIAAIMYAISFFKAWQEELRQKEKVKREALSLRYKVLQDQINPHFLFNSLNVLGSLIDIDVDKAKQFTRELSTFYRKVLQLKDLDIITLKEEIDFVEKYIYLQQIRFGEALQVDIIANDKVTGRVIPLSLQALVENAIKHNEMSIASPLKIVIAVSDEYELVVENNLQPKKLTDSTSGTGLQNLAGRYEYLTGKKMNVTRNAHYYRITMPLIKLEN
jgi:two-component system LytT family sensor kinase